MNSILLGLTQLFLLFFGGTKPSGPAVSSVAPATVLPGGSFIVKVTIYSGHRKCTAHLEQELSEGVTATVEDAGGAQVQNKNNILRFNWFLIPAKQSITVSYKVTLTGTDRENVRITGRYFSAYNGKHTHLMTRPLLIKVSTARADSPIIRSQAPAAASPGDTVAIETIIDKADYMDMARLTLALPEDAVITPVDGENARFLAEGNAYKFLWSIVPPKQVMKVRYKLAIPGDATDTLKISGDYSFTVNNTSATVPVPPIHIAIKNPPAVTVQPVAGNVKVNRRMPATANQVFYVDVTIDKGALKAGGVLEETLPEGYTAALIAAEGCKLEMLGNVARFTWLTFPAQNRIRLVYKVNVKPGSTGDKSITGRFRFTENDTAKVADAGVSKITITGERPAAAVAAIPDDLKPADKNNDQFISSAELNEALAAFAAKGSWSAEQIDRLVAVFIYQ